MPSPTAILSPLHRADGSVTYSHDGYSVIAAVNGPLEVQRRDELPEEAAIEVNIRPAFGVATPKERHLESLIHSTLRHVILVRNLPRTLIQVTLQILSLPEGDSAGDRALPSSSALPLLPPLLQASIISLISASIPLFTVFTSLILAVLPSGEIQVSPTTKQLPQATSVHVFAFSPQGALLLAESEGNFDMDGWDKAYSVAEEICCCSKDATVGDKMEVDERRENLAEFLKKVVREKVEREQRWKSAP